MEEVKKQNVELSDAEKVINLTKENAYLREMLGKYDAQLREMSNGIGLKRIELLFKVVENSLVFGDEMTQKAIKEISAAFGFSEEENDESAKESTEE